MATPIFQQAKYFIGSATRTATFTLDTAPAEDDVIYLCLTSGTTATVDDPVDWENGLGADTDVESTAHQGTVFAHAVTSGEAGTSQVTWTLTNLFGVGETFQGHAVVFRDVDTANMFDDIDSDVESTPTTTVTVPALTPTVTDGVVLAFVANDAGTANNATPAGWTSRSVNSSGAETQVFSFDTATTATVDTPTAAVVGASDEKLVIAFIVPPASSPPPAAVSQGWGIAL